MQYTEPVNVYRPADTIAADKSLVPGKVEFVWQLTGNIQRGSKAASDRATSIGIFDRKSAIAYFPVGSEEFLGDRFVLKDAKGECWLVREGPIVRDRFPSTAHTWVFCEFMAIKPAGVD